MATKLTNKKEVPWFLRNNGTLNFAYQIADLSKIGEGEAYIISWLLASS